MEKQFSTVLAEVNSQEGVVIIRYLPLDSTLEMAQEHVAKIKEMFAEQIPVLCLSDISNIKNAPKTVRDYFASKEVATMMKASAIVTGSGLSKIVGNIFLQFSKPQCPTKLFTDVESARAWLKKL